MLPSSPHQKWRAGGRYITPGSLGSQRAADSESSSLPKPAAASSRSGTQAGMRIPGLPRKVFEPAPLQNFTVSAYFDATLPRSRTIALAS